MKVRYDDFWILTCLRRRIELPFAAPLPLGETFGLVLEFDGEDMEQGQHFPTQ